MKARFFYIMMTLAIFGMGIANSQIVLPAQRTVISENDKASIDNRIREYTTFTIDKKELMKDLYTNGTCQFQLIIDEKLNWMLDLEFNDMRSHDFKQTKSKPGQNQTKSYGFFLSSIPPMR